MSFGSRRTKWTFSFIILVQLFPRGVTHNCCCDEWGVCVEGNVCCYCDDLGPVYCENYKECGDERINPPHCYGDIALTRPKTHEAWHTEYTSLIKWEWTGFFPTVNLSLCSTSGDDDCSSDCQYEIARNVENTGRYYYTVRTEMRSGTYYVRIQAADAPDVFGCGNDFDIRSHTVREVGLVIGFGGPILCIFFVIVAYLWCVCVRKVNKRKQFISSTKSKRRFPLGGRRRTSRTGGFAYGNEFTEETSLPIDFVLPQAVKVLDNDDEFLDEQSSDSETSSLFVEQRPL